MTTTLPVVETPSTFKMYRALVGIGLCCGLLIVGVFEFTKPIIKANQKAAREAAILEVLPGATTSQVFVMNGDTATLADADESGSDLVFAGYDDSGALIGLALEAQKTGYQDVVKIIYGYKPDEQNVIGFKVLESKETPGLGDRVETDPQYLANFEALDVSVNEAGDAVANQIVAVKPGEKTERWQIDTISGATITSACIADMVSESTARRVPALFKNLEVFKAEGKKAAQSADAEEAR